MALAKSSQTTVSAQPAAAGTPVLGNALALNYGVSGIAKITNGATPPTIACGFYLDFSVDGTNWVTGPLIGLADTVANSVTYIPFALGIGGGADWAYYRGRFAGNTVQAVTVQADASTTTGL
jgi:hypothetical protein